MITKRLLITGRVQGVGFRDWLAAEARRLGVAGWVRNVGDDMVEAVIAGEAEVVGACLHGCWHGPAMAIVDQLIETDAEPPQETEFVRRPSVPRPP